MLPLKGRSKNNPCCCYSLFSFCPAERDFVTHSASLNLIRTKKFFEDAKGVPRKSEQPTRMQRALRGFSSSPRLKGVFY